MAFSSIDELEVELAEVSYLTDRGLATALFLAVTLGKPLLLEGEAGVGKTEAAKAIAASQGASLIRLQCYEGLDVTNAVYEWNYARQLLHIRAAQAGTVDEAELFGREFLIRRPILEALESDDPVVLLIDEVDRADEEFEAFLLEVLSDFQVTVPEIGTFTAKQPPVVVLTSNRTRELNDALKRRCLYLWIDYPSPAKERDIVLRKVPGIEARLAEQVVGIMHTLRAVDFYKRPGIAETLDWSRALVGLRVGEIGATTLEETAGCLLKYHDDIERLKSIGAGNVIEGNVDPAGAPETAWK